MEHNPVIFQPPPQIPSGLPDLIRYELELRDYKLRTRSVLYIFLQVIGSLLLLGVIWINVEWIRLGVTIVAILMALILLNALSYIL
jgi:hypothetical protein